MREPARILIADDTPANLHILQLRLAASGYEIITATDGEEAITAARQHHPDLNPGDKAAEARFKEIAEAHEVLRALTKEHSWRQVFKALRGTWTTETEYELPLIVGYVAAVLNKWKLAARYARRPCSARRWAAGARRDVRPAR